MAGASAEAAAGGASEPLTCACTDMRARWREALACSRDARALDATMLACFLEDLTNWSRGPEGTLVPVVKVEGVRGDTQKALNGCQSGMSVRATRRHPRSMFKNRVVVVCVCVALCVLCV